MTPSAPQVGAAILPSGARKLVFLLAGVAFTGHAASNPQQVLEQARARLQPMLRNLAKYVCTETVERKYYEPDRPENAVALPQSPTPACGQAIAGKKGNLGTEKLKSTDRLRLEVSVSEGREIYSWPGATRFDSRDMDEIIHEGPIGTGSFATHLLGVFDNPGVEFQFAGEQTLGDRSAFQYDFHVPLAVSRYRVKVGSSWQRLAYDGSFWLDPNSLDLRRLTVRVANSPPGSWICDLAAEFDYRQVSIGDSEALLPSQSQLRIGLENASRSNNITTFTGCREYKAESALSFEEDSPVAPKASAAFAFAPIALPIGLPVTLALTAPIDTESAAAGDPVTATVVQAVRRANSHETLIPAGVTVHGRITRVEHHLLPVPYFLIAMSFNWMMLERGASLFAARFEGNIELARSLGVNLFGPGRGLGYWDVGTFLFPTGKSRYVIPAGFESKWFTLATRGR